MPKATLTFKLPEEDSEHRLAINGHKYYSILWEFDQWLRSEMKYQDHETIQTESVRDKLRELMDNDGVNFDEVA
jgi:hypothetical protein